MKKVRAAVLAGVLVLVGSGLAALAGLQRAGGGYLTTPAGDFSVPTAVVLTDEIDVGTGAPGDPDPDLGELARLRVRVTAADPSTPLFVGIGPRDAVHAWVEGTAHSAYAGAETAPFRPRFDLTPGAAVPPPADTGPWVAQGAGVGEATLQWDKRHGPWSLVVLDPGGAGLEVRADLGFRFGSLGPLGVGLIATGLLAGSLINRRRRATSAAVSA